MAKQLYEDCLLVWKYVVEYMGVLGTDECIEMMINFVDFFFVDEDNRPYWYRPELQVFKAEIQKLTSYVYGHKIFYPDHEYKILEKFHSL